ASGVDDAPGANRLARHDAEVEQDLAQELLAGEKRVQYERCEQLHIELLEHRPAHRGLASTDIAAQDGHALASLDRLQQLPDGFFVRRTWVEESRVWRERERRLREAVELLVLQ